MHVQESYLHLHGVEARRHPYCAAIFGSARSTAGVCTVESRGWTTPDRHDDPPKRDDRAQSQGSASKPDGYLLGS
jgi:hypothetical protein